MSASNNFNFFTKLLLHLSMLFFEWPAHLSITMLQPACPHLLVRATGERFLPAGATFKDGLVSESHWLQPVVVLTVHW